MVLFGSTLTPTLPLKRDAPVTSKLLIVANPVVFTILKDASPVVVCLLKVASPVVLVLPLISREYTDELSG